MTVQTEDVLTSWSLDTKEMQAQLAKMKNNLGDVEEKFSKTSTATIAFGTALGNVATAAIGALKDKMGQLSKIAIDYEDDVAGNVKALEGMRLASGGLVSNLDLMHAKMRLQNGDLQLSEEQLSAVTKAAMQYSRVNSVEFAQALDTITNAIERGTARSIRGLGIAFDETGTRAQKQAKILESIEKKFSGMKFEAENASEQLITLGAAFDNIVGAIGTAILKTETFQTAMKNLVSFVKEVDEYFGKSGERRAYEEMMLRAREIRAELEKPLSGNWLTRVFEENNRAALREELKGLEAVQRNLREGQANYEAIMDLADKYGREMEFTPDEGTSLTLSPKKKKGKKEKTLLDWLDEEWAQKKELQTSMLEELDALTAAEKDYAKFVEENRQIAFMNDVTNATAKQSKAEDDLAKKKAKQKAIQEALTQSYKDYAINGLGTALGALNQLTIASVFAGDSAGDAAKAALSGLASALGQEAQIQAMKQFALALSNPYAAPAHLGAMAAWEALALAAGGLGAATSRTSSKASTPSYSTNTRTMSGGSPSYREPESSLSAGSEQKEQVINIYFGNPESPVANLIATKKITALRA